MKVKMDAPLTTSSECDRINLRREHLGLESTDKLQQWALALSGGGIRSATFSLGILQALARANSQAKPDAKHSLLARWDYLSTVSGGSYIGGFLVSLFLPGRLNGGAQNLSQNATAREDALNGAIESLRCDPPTRMGLPGTDKSPKFSTAWLRENGRYLAPNGAGDLMLAAALALRNFLALHFVIATVVLSFFLFSQAVQKTLLNCPPGLSPLSIWLLIASAQVIVVVFPLGMAYWLPEVPDGETSRSDATWLSKASGGYLACAAVVGVIGWLTFGQVSTALTWLFGSVAFWCVAGVIVHGGFSRHRTVQEERHRLTQALSLGLTWVLVFAGVGLVETAAQWLYTILQDDAAKHVAWSSALAAPLAWLAHKLAPMLGDKAKDSWLGRLPVLTLLGILGLFFAMLVVMVWSLVAIWMIAQLQGPSYLAWGLVAIAALMAWIAGYFPGFVNLSSWHSYYSAHLRRAYLGASNPARGDKLGVTRAHPDDEPDRDLYRSQHLGPLHFVNVCVNQTMGGKGQLVQRDRKGENLAVGPLGCWLGARAFDWKHIQDSSTAANAFPKDFAVSEWIGLSGAAAAPGMGRAGSLGLALLLGLANVRLGQWWLKPQKTSVAKSWCGGLFKSQTYLFSELTARFKGQDKDLLYLSDGGHFDNTGLYEMLRPERNIRFMLACDNGEDAACQFEDLANLIRLARIDHGLHIELDTDWENDMKYQKSLSKCLASPTQLQDKVKKLRAGETAVDTRCAMLFKVYQSKPDGSKVLSAFILFAKPVLIAGLPQDLMQYAQAHSSFPNESTGDQFFDEAQWESYRTLGLGLGETLFGTSEGYSQCH